MVVLKLRPDEFFDGYPSGKFVHKASQLRTDDEVETRRQNQSSYGAECGVGIVRLIDLQISSLEGIEESVFENRQVVVAWPDGHGDRIDIQKGRPNEGLDCVRKSEMANGPRIFKPPNVEIELVPCLGLSLFSVLGSRWTAATSVRRIGYILR
jgi:hypothetical protein